MFAKPKTAPNATKQGCLPTWPSKFAKNRAGRCERFLCGECAGDRESAKDRSSNGNSGLEFEFQVVPLLLEAVLFL